ncbi:MAG: methyltransferase domain-containing protein, partial [Sulfurimonas sp.]
MKIEKQFSKYAYHYGRYNVIQEKVASKLLSHIKGAPKNILDLGCGRGAIVEKIDWEYEHFTGVDFASGMLELHPKSKAIECIYGDFNDSKLYKKLALKHFDYIVSSSALQWANNLSDVFDNIAALKTSVSLAIFTSGTLNLTNQQMSIAGNWGNTIGTFTST